MDEFLADPDAPARGPQPADRPGVLPARATWTSGSTTSAICSSRRRRQRAATGRANMARCRRVASTPSATSGTSSSATPAQTGEPGVVLHRPHQRAQPHAAHRPHRGDQPLRRAAAAAVRGLQPGQHQPGLLRARTPCTPQADVDWDALRETIHVVDRASWTTSSTPTTTRCPQIDAMCKANRKIGLGVMGFADALFKLGVPYNSEEGVAWGERFMKFVNDEAHAYSEQLAARARLLPQLEGQHLGHRSTTARCATPPPPPSPRPARSASSPTAPAASSRCSAWPSSATCSGRPASWSRSTSLSAPWPRRAASTARS